MLIAQERDGARIIAAMEAAGLGAADRPGAATLASGCWLVAWVGDSAAGVAGLETIVDAAALHVLAVAQPMRRRGIGAMLLAAARKAAFTRGARRLYAALPEGADYLRRFGFEDVAERRMLDDMAGASLISELAMRLDTASEQTVLMVDISRDGVIER